MTIRRLLFIREFEELYREHYSRMYYFSLTIVGEEELARDVVGEVFSRVWDDFDTIDRRQMGSYLMTSVRNRSIDTLRRQKRQQEYIDHITRATESAEDYAATDREEKLQRIEAAIAELPELTQHVLTLCYYNHKTHAEAAAQLDITPRMVKRHIQTALAKIRTIVGSENA